MINRQLILVAALVCLVTTSVALADKPQECELGQPCESGIVPPRARNPEDAPQTSDGHHEVPGWIAVEKMKTFLNKNKRCTLAVGERETGDRVDAKIYCIADITQSPGTVHEFTGCTFAKFDSEHDTYSGTYGSSERMAVVQKRCSEGGFMDLMDKKAFLVTDDGSQFFTVKDVLVNGLSVSGEKMIRKQSTVFLFAAHPRYREWWDQFVKAGAK